MTDQHKWIGTIAGIIGIATFITGISSLSMFIKALEIRQHTKAVEVERSEARRRADIFKPEEFKPDEQVTSVTPKSLPAAPTPATPKVEQQPEVSPPVESPKPEVRDLQFTTAFDVNGPYGPMAPYFYGPGLQIVGTFIAKNFVKYDRFDQLVQITVLAVFYSQSGVPITSREGQTPAGSDITFAIRDGPVNFGLFMPYLRLNAQGDLSYRIVIVRGGDIVYISPPANFVLRQGFPGG